MIYNNEKTHNKIWAIIGAGSGGQTLAGHLAILGEEVRIYSGTPAKVQKLNWTKKIEIKGAINGMGEISFATNILADAVTGAENIVIVLPSNYHEKIARRLIPLLEDGQNILLLPEASCGAIAFRKIMRELKCNKKITLTAASTLPYATRATEVGLCNVFGLKHMVKIAALPATDNELLKKIYCEKLSFFNICSSVIETSIDNNNAMLHPAPCILGTSRIEALPAQNYEFYREGITPSIANVIEEMDRERIRIALAYGYKQRNIRQQLSEMYNLDFLDDSLWAMLQKTEVYYGIMNVKSLNERHITEDIPYSLEALSSLAKIAGIPCPCIDSIIAIGHFMIGDEMDEGRTINNLGINKVSKQEFIDDIMGIKPYK